jgi:hypothetical protein
MELTYISVMELLNGMGQKLTIPAEEVCKQEIDIQACLEELDETDVIEQFWNEHYV